MAFDSGAVDDVPVRDVWGALKANPKAWQGWLKDVTTFDGQPGLDAVNKSLGL